MPTSPTSDAWRKAGDAPQERKQLVLTLTLNNKDLPVKLFEDDGLPEMMDKAKYICDA